MSQRFVCKIGNHKFARRKMGGFLFDFGVEKLFLTVTPKQENMDEFDYTVIKASCMAKQPQPHHTIKESKQKS